MMNFSDETVRKAARAIMLGGDCGGDTDFLVQGKPAYEHLMPESQAALSSLTIADLMQVEEVRELVHRAENVNIAIGMGWDLEGVVDLSQKALTPFVEPKQ